ncbi:hypothetical protein Tco_0971589 [Tanacetum coccineum]
MFLYMDQFQKQLDNEEFQGHWKSHQQIPTIHSETRLFQNSVTTLIPNNGIVMKSIDVRAQHKMDVMKEVIIESNGLNQKRGYKQQIRTVHMLMMQISDHKCEEPNGYIVQSFRGKGLQSLLLSKTDISANRASRNFDLMITQKIIGIKTTAMNRQDSSWFQKLFSSSQDRLHHRQELELLFPYRAMRGQQVLHDNCKYSALPGPESIKNQESEKSPKEIIRIKREQGEEKQDSTYSIRSTDKVALEEFDLKSALFKHMNKNKTANRNPANYHLYHALMEALIADEDAMDKEVAVKVKDHKRKHDSDDEEDDDDDEGPSAGSNQGRSAKRRRPESAASGSAQPPSKDDHQSSKKPRESDASASKQHPALTSTGWQITDTRDDVVNSLMHMLPNNIQITDTNSFIVSKKRSSDSSKKLKGIQTLTPAEQEAADIMKALKESKKMSKRQPGTGGSNEGTGNILGVPDESTVISRASSEGTGSKPGVPDEEKLIL